MTVSRIRFQPRPTAAIALIALLAACQSASEASPTPFNSPSATTSASPATSPTSTPSTTPTASVGQSPTASPIPTAIPTVTPTTPPTAPPTVAPSPAPATLGEWARIRDFPRGSENFVRVAAVTAGGPGYVAVGFVGDGGGNTESGRVWTSADGRDWSIQPSEAFPGAKLEIVIEHLDTLYALGPIPTDDPDFPDVGAYNVWSSPDGVSWTLIPQPAAFQGEAVLLGAISAGETLIAFGYRDAPDASSRPGVWSWTPTASGSQWQLADSLPDTFDVRRMAYADDFAVALGNAVGDGLPSRSVWHSTDEGRTWAAADVPFILEPGVHLSDVAANVDPTLASSPSGIYVAVGSEVVDREIWPVALPTTQTREWFEGGRLAGIPMHQMERLVAIPGGFLALGAEMRYVIDQSCAPGPCEGLEAEAGAAWTSADGRTWQPAAPLPVSISWEFAGIAVGAPGVVVSSGDRVWFAPLGAQP